MWLKGDIKDEKRNNLNADSSNSYEIPYACMPCRSD